MLFGAKGKRATEDMFSASHKFHDGDRPCGIQVTIKDSAVAFEVISRVRMMQIECIAKSPHLEIQAFDDARGTLSYRIRGVMTFFALLRMRGMKLHTFLIRVRVVSSPRQVWFDVKKSLREEPEFDMGAGLTMDVNEVSIRFRCDLEYFTEIPLPDRDSRELDAMLSLEHSSLPLVLKRFKDEQLLKADKAMEEAGTVIAVVQDELRRFGDSHHSAPRLAATILKNWCFGGHKQAVEASEYLIVGHVDIARNILGMPPRSKPKALETKGDAPTGAS